MTIFTVYNNFNAFWDNKTPNNALLESVPIVNALPDTALLRGGKPFFIPDFANPCTCQSGLAIRICRLGRSISPRFAHRYYDAVTVGVTFTAKNLLQQCRENGLPWSVCTGFDGSASVGEFIPLSEEMSLAQAEFTLLEDGQPVQSCSMKGARFTAEEIIGYVSRFHLLRQGDVIFLGFPAQPVEARMNTRLTASLAGRQVLGFNVK